jgi:hypothetical protein
MVPRAFSVGEALYTKIVLIANWSGASDPDLSWRGQIMTQREHNHELWNEGHLQTLTVDVMSAEQTSQTYLTPPSPPRVAVFFLITPM